MQKRASHSEQARNASHSELALTATRTEEEENLLVELEQLRESTKSALLESWAEVEHLHEENAVFQVREFDLQTELEASKNREELYKMELEKLKNQLTYKRNLAPQEAAQDNSKLGNGSPALSVDNASNLCQRDTSTTSDQTSNSAEGECETRREINRWGAGWIMGSFRDNERDEMEREFILQMTKLEREKNNLIAEWQHKVESRNEALLNMEILCKTQGILIDELKTKLDTRSKQFREKETRLRKEIDFLKTKIAEKRAIIFKQSDEIKKYQTSTHGIKNKKGNFA